MAKYGIKCDRSCHRSIVSDLRARQTLTITTPDNINSQLTVREIESDPGIS